MKALGTIGFRDRDDWQPKVYYRKMDMVRHERSTLYATEDHTSGDIFDESKWGYLADVRGVEAAKQHAEEAAQLAEEHGATAEVQAEKAAQAAQAANEEAEKAKDATGIFGDNFKTFISDEYVYAISDSEGSLLFGIKRDGSVYQPKGIPEEVKNRLNDLGGWQVMENDEYVFAICDSEGNIVFAIDRKGKAHVLGIKGVCEMDQYEGSEFAFAVMDSNEQVLMGVTRDGSFYADKGMSVEQKAENKRLDKRINDLEKALANFSGGTGDWSDASAMRIPIPRCAMLNIKSGTMPTAKSGMGVDGVTCNILCEVEFWDQQGNYFKKWVLMSAQGNSSMVFIKKNLAFDFFMSKDDAKNDGDTFVMKFGDWVEQDSFHLKAYYTDTFRGKGAVGYMVGEQIAKSRSLMDDRPYKEAFMDKTSFNNGYDCNTDMNMNFDTGAKCFPQGFPVIVYQNGEFYGVYSWQIKKHRDNYWMNKKTATHVHLDGTLGAASIFGGTIDWTQFEVRNPKSLYMQVKNNIKGEDTLKYNGDYPRELMGTDSDFYDKSNKDMKRCAQVKGYIEALAGRMAEFAAAEKAGASAEEMRELIGKYFKVSFSIDYILFGNVFQHGDGFNKNWQWTTWDGEQWVPNLYDLDGIFGAYHSGNFVSSPNTNWYGNSTTIPSGWIIKYFKPELDARYAELRKLGIFTADNIVGLLKDWMDRVGYENWVKEYKKWDESPCNRDSHINTKYWVRSTSYTTEWVATTSYAKGGVCTRNRRTFKSLISANVGNDPLTDTTGAWQEMTYDSTKQYAVGDVCYYGKNTFYGFKCVEPCVDEAPLTEFYTATPAELGHYDSIYRVYNWMVARIKTTDKFFGYSE